MPRALRLRAALLAPLVLLAACTRQPVPEAAPVPVPVPAPAAAAAATAEVPLAVRWVRTSAEHQALFHQVYTSAGRALEQLAQGQPTGQWAVILDADETVLDNSTYQRRRALLDSAFTPESWSAWVAERDASVLPGAAEFLATVRRLGGRVVIVTNRTQAECDDTRANLAALQLSVDAVLCRPPESGDKNARFVAVERGTAVPGLPPLAVLMYVGDNIQDFPGLSQAVRTASAAVLEPFGRRWFLLPNPMYGSWERNPDR